MLSSRKILVRSISILLALLSAVNVSSREPLPIDEPNNKRTVTFATEGEDATSTFYYFFYSLPYGDEVSKLRVLWNGGSGNKPTITDYYFLGTFVWIIERSAERHDLPTLLKGQDVAFQTVRERYIKTLSVENDRLYTFPDAGEIPRLSEAERKEWTNLISILTKIRKPIKHK